MLLWGKVSSILQFSQAMMYLGYNRVAFKDLCYLLGLFPSLLIRLLLNCLELTSGSADGVFVGACASMLKSIVFQFWQPVQVVSNLAYYFEQTPTCTEEVFDIFDQNLHFCSKELWGELPQIYNGGTSAFLNDVGGVGLWTLCVIHVPANLASWVGLTQLSICLPTLVSISEINLLVEEKGFYGEFITNN